MKLRYVLKISEILEENNQQNSQEVMRDAEDAMRTVDESGNLRRNYVLPTPFCGQ